MRNAISLFTQAISDQPPDGLHVETVIRSQLAEQLAERYKTYWVPLLQTRMFR